MAMAFSQLLQSDTRLFAKSEFGPASRDWPALSFSAEKIAREFQNQYRRGRDFVVYVGTSNKKDTPDIHHRQRLVSVVDAEPRAIVRTPDIVEPEAWARAQLIYPGRWNLSLRLARAWTVKSFPKAHDALPATYAKFQNPGTRGHPIAVESSDYALLAAIELEPTNLFLTKRAAGILGINSEDELLRRELSRLTAGVMSDIDRSQKSRDGRYPLRTAPKYSDVYGALMSAWNKQNGHCRLCGAPISLGTANKLLQISKDRIDSADKSYAAANVHLTHLGCNLAKSSATLAEWEEYRALLRSSA